MTINIALTNLGKYNEGTLLFTWLELPATDEELRAAFEEIEVADGTEYEEHFISDYEAPKGIEIGEYASVTKLNELAEQLEGLTLDNIVDGTYDAGDVITLAHEMETLGFIEDANYYIGDIISDEDLDEMARQRAEDSWQSVAHFLARIEYMTDDYFYINGYANAENLTAETLDSIVHDLMNAIKGAI